MGQCTQRELLFGSPEYRSEKCVCVCVCGRGLVSVYVRIHIEGGCVNYVTHAWWWARRSQPAFEFRVYQDQSAQKKNVQCSQSQHKSGCRTHCSLNPTWNFFSAIMCVCVCVACFHVKVSVWSQNWWFGWDRRIADFLTSGVVGCPCAFLVTSRMTQPLHAWRSERDKMTHRKGH